MDFNYKNWSQTQILSVAVVLVVLVGAIGFLYSRGGTSKSQQNPTAAIADSINPSLQSSAPSAGQNSLSAKNQAAGMSAVVGALTLAHDGWVAVHEDRNGAPGNILGAQWLPAGSHTNVNVDLLRAMRAGATYYAMLHSDDGDHQFDKATDLPVSGSGGATVMAMFTTTVEK